MEIHYNPFSSSLAQSPDETPEALTGAVLPTDYIFFKLISPHPGV